jgi:hypothetical protein
MILAAKNSRTIFFSLFFCIAFVSICNARTVSNLYSGNWYDGSIWTGGSVPTVLDVVTITGGTMVTLLYEDYVNGQPPRCDSMTINGFLDVGAVNFTIGGRDLYTDYRAIRNSSCIINGRLRINGDWNSQFKVYGNMKFNWGSTFDMPAGKIMIDGAGFTPELSVPADKALLDVTEVANFNSTGGQIILFNPHFFQGGLSIKGAKDFFAIAFGNNDALTNFAARTTNDFLLSESESPRIKNVYLKYLPNPSYQNKVILNEGMTIETLQLAKGILTDKRGRLKFTKDVLVSENTVIECDVEMNGTGEQKIGTFNNSNLGVIKGNLIINNPYTIQCFVNLELQNGTVQFMQGKLDLTDKTLTVDRQPTGANANAYMVTKNNYSGNGTLVIKNLQGTTLFPVGTSNDYLPATLTAFGSDFSVSARALLSYPNNGAFPINAQWDIRRTQGWSPADVRLQWKQETETNNFSVNRSAARVFRGEWGNWYPLAQNYGVETVSNNSVFAKTVQNVDYFTTFTVLTETVIPVELKRFYAKKQTNTDVTLAWETASEVNNAGFDVEKSTDGRTFTTIGFVKGVGNSVALNSYNFMDNNFTATAYYRLKQMDVNGKSTYSPTISVQKSTGKLTLNVFPNLVTNESNITIDLTNAAQNTQELSVYDVNGRLVFESRKANLTEVPVVDFAKGLYVVKVKNGVETVVAKFVKN